SNILTLSLHDALPIYTCKGKINTFDELVAYCGFYFTDDIVYSPEGVAKNLTAENKPRLQAIREAFVRIENFSANEIEAAMKATRSEEHTSELQSRFDL